MTDALRDALRPLIAELVDEALACRDAGPARLLTIPEAQAALGGLSRPSLYQLLNTGALRSVKAGRRRLIPASAIAEFIEARAR